MRTLNPIGGALVILLLSLGCTVLSDQPVEDPPLLEDPPVSQEPTPAGEAPPLETVAILPPLSPTELVQREDELAAWVQSELDMAGLGKVTNLGKPISPELTDFRQAWEAVNPDVAPFLGTWVRDWNLMPYDYMTVFPSTLPGVVCLVRYRQEETETVPIQTITTPLEFSVGQVIDGQLRSNRTQTTRSLIRFTPGGPYISYDIEFIGTVEPDGNLRLYAAQQPPTLDPAWEPRLLAQLAAHQCTDAMP